VITALDPNQRLDTGGADHALGERSRVAMAVCQRAL